ncbi:hypothetical protein WT83_04905 [Burkholderia territorii]|uniref:Uncharacterized protein n=2 Tax=Burkholderia territorii TaxID=1503055 RepID=A0A108F2R6_9BURK|nr:hypothetical protein WT83_04905 [Burkholderia territorii]
MALVVATTGLLASILIGVLRPSASGTSDADAQTRLDTVHHSIVGYALTHFALPAGQGWLDSAELGLPSNVSAWYRADTRLMPGALSLYTPDPNHHVPQYVGANGQPVDWPLTPAQSGLNFCATLLAAQQTPQIRVAGIPVALVMQVSSNRDAPEPDLSVLPGSAQAQALAAKGIRLRAVGFGEMMTYLHCPVSLIHAGSVAKSIVSASDMGQISRIIERFRRLKYARAWQTVFTDDFQIFIRALLMANIVADLVSTTGQIKAATPTTLDAVNVPGMIQLIGAIGADAVLMGFLAIQLEIVSTIDPGMNKENSDLASLRSAEAAIGTAQTYTQQLQQLLGSQESYYRAALGGAL